MVKAVPEQLLPPQAFPRLSGEHRTRKARTARVDSNIVQKVIASDWGLMMVVMMIMINDNDDNDDNENENNL